MKHLTKLPTKKTMKKITNPENFDEGITRTFNNEWNAVGHMLKETCPVCKKKFKLNEKFILCPIQEPKGDYIINSVAIPIHTECYYVDEI